MHACMAHVILASIFFSAAVVLAYAEELRELLGTLAPTAAPRPALALAPAGPEIPVSMLDSLVRDVTGPDPARRERAFQLLPNFPPGELTRSLVGVLDGPVNDLRDRVADLLLRHGGESVLEPLHRYFRDRDASLEDFEDLEALDLFQEVDEFEDLEAGFDEPVQVHRFPTERARSAPVEPRSLGQGPGVVLPLRPRRNAGPPRIRHGETRGPEMGDLAFPAEVLSPDPELRAKALADLPASGHPHGYELLCRVLACDPDTLVRGVAAAALGRLPEEHGGMRSLCEATRDPEPSVRWNACFALGKMGNPRAKTALRFAENDPDGSVRLAARKALEALGLDPPMPALYEL